MVDIRKAPDVVADSDLLELDAEFLPDSVEDLIRHRTNGHPLFVEELVYALRDSGTIEVVDGSVRLTGDLDEFAARKVAGSLDGVITNRINRLAPSEQLTLKVASVIGYEFPYHILRDIFPLERERAELQEHLDGLVASRVTRLTGDRNEYLFRNHTTRDVAYNMVLRKHRIELHRAIAEWIAEHRAGDIGLHYPLLAEHWLQSGETRRAVDYLAKAGESALENNANREAARFYHS